MTPLDALKTELRAVLPRGFLRRARADEWLLVSDFPRFSGENVSARLADAGWRCARQGETLLLDLTPARYALLIASLPPARGIALTDDNLPRFSLVKRLAREAVAPERQPVAPLRLTLKYLGTREESRLYALLPPMIAALLRAGEALPAAVAGLLSNDGGEDEPC